MTYVRYLPSLGLSSLKFPHAKGEVALDLQIQRAKALTMVLKWDTLTKRLAKYQCVYIRLRQKAFGHRQHRNRPHRRGLGQLQTSFLRLTCLRHGNKPKSNHNGTMRVPCATSLNPRAMETCRQMLLQEPSLRILASRLRRPFYRTRSRR